MIKHQVVLIVPVVFAAAAMVSDLRMREISNWIPVTILAAALIALAAGVLPVSADSMLLGVIVALGLGLVLFKIGAWGGGDVKLLVALAGWIGPAGLLATVIWMGLIGAAVAIGVAVRGGKDLAYGPAIAGGFTVYAVWPHALSALLR